MSSPTASAIHGILNVAVPVSDHQRALDFYCGVLGLEIRRDAPFGPGLRWVEVAPRGAATTIALAPHREGTPIGVDTGIRLGTSDVHATQVDLATRGVDVDARVMRLGPEVPPMFRLRDPDGNTLVVVEAPAPTPLSPRRQEPPAIASHGRDCAGESLPAAATGAESAIRSKLMQALAALGESTITQLVSTLGFSRGSVTYHMRTLQASGAVRVSRTRQVRAVTERYFVLEPGPHWPMSSNRDALLMMRQFVAEYGGSIVSPPLILRTQLQPTRLAALECALRQLASEFSIAGGDEQAAASVAILLATGRTSSNGRPFSP